MFFSNQAVPSLAGNAPPPWAPGLPCFLWSSCPTQCVPSPPRCGTSHWMGMKWYEIRKNFLSLNFLLLFPHYVSVLPRGPLAFLSSLSLLLSRTQKSVACPWLDKHHITWWSCVLVALCPSGAAASLQVAPAGLLLNITFLPIGSWRAVSPLASEALGRLRGCSVITSYVLRTVLGIFFPHFTWFCLIMT